MKVLWALVKVLDEIRAQLVRLNLNMEAGQPDLTRRPGESESDYWRRLKAHEPRMPPISLSGTR